MTPVVALRAVADDALRRFFEAVRGRRPAGAEMSFKLCGAMVLRHRVLVGYRRDELGATAVAAICDTLGMPPAYTPEIAAAMEQADFVHFGFERNVDGWVRKVYLEYRAPAELRPGALIPPVLYDAWKWGGMDAAAGTRAQYCLLPGKDVATARNLVSRHYANAQLPALAPAIGAVLDQAGRTLGDGGLMCLVVGESGNPRSSFDINLHESGLRVSALAACLGRLATCFTLPWKELEAAFEAARDRRLGHVSGGIDRRGGAFATFYYDAPELIHGLD